MAPGKYGPGLLSFYPSCMFCPKKGDVMENPRLIVMPLVPIPGKAFNGTGLGIHFLIRQVPGHGWKTRSHSRRF
jgi:hypothetical protein